MSIFDLKAQVKVVVCDEFSMMRPAVGNSECVLKQQINSRVGESLEAYIGILQQEKFERQIMWLRSPSHVRDICTWTQISTTWWRSNRQEVLHIVYHLADKCKPCWRQFALQKCLDIQSKIPITTRHHDLGTREALYVVQTIHYTVYTVSISCISPLICCHCLAYAPHS